MFMARVTGTAVATAKHPTLEGCRFLLVQRVEADGALAEEPNLVIDWQGATNGSTVIISTDGDIARARLGNKTPARMVVMGIVDSVSALQPFEMVSA